MPQPIKLIFLALLLMLSISGCTAAVLIPPLAGPLFVPSTAVSAYQIYRIGNDERDLQTIIEDEYTESRIIASILKDKDLEVLGLSSYSYNGHVYIVGKYDDKKDFSRISRAVHNSGKVNSLTTYLYPEMENPPCNSAEDIILENKVRAALMENKSTRKINVAVKAVQCNIILLGRVRSSHEINEVKNVTASVGGIASIKSFIRPTFIQHYKIEQRNIAAAR